MKKKKFMKQLGGHWAVYAEVAPKYTHLLPSLTLIHDGQIWPTGISLRFLWLGVTFVWVA